MHLGKWTDILSSVNLVPFRVWVKTRERYFLPPSRFVNIAAVLVEGFV